MVTEGRQKPPPPPPSPLHPSFPASFESIISGQDYMQSPFYIRWPDKKDIDGLKSRGPGLSNTRVGSVTHARS